MKKEVPVAGLEERVLSFGDHAYPFFSGSNCLDPFVQRLEAMDGDLYILVTDAVVDTLYAQQLRSRLAASQSVLSLVIEPAGEPGKSFETLGRLTDQVFAAGATRRSVVVTVGGGVPGNIGGLLASLLFRGIRLVHVPTTLIGMFDSVVSLKQAVNTPHGKNLLGTYYRPEMVLADLATLESLPEEQVRSGLCEVIKNALVIDPSVIPELEKRLSPACELSGADAQWLLEISLRAKATVMADDPRERHLGVVLEYGHTVGHAMELADSQRTGGRGLSHGEGVAIGMLVAAEVAARLDLLTPEALATHYRLVDLIGARRTAPPELTARTVLDLVGFDNKRGYCSFDRDDVAMILLRDLGEVAGEEDRPLTPVPRALLASVVKRFCPSTASQEAKVAP